MLIIDSGPVHTYPDIFESATFSFRIQKFPRPHVPIRLFTRIHSGFRNVRIRFHLSNSPDACGQKPYSERKSCGFKNIRLCVDRASDDSVNKKIWNRKINFNIREIPQVSQNLNIMINLHSKYFSIFINHIELASNVFRCKVTAYVSAIRFIKLDMAPISDPYRL